MYTLIAGLFMSSGIFGFGFTHGHAPIIRSRPSPTPAPVLTPAFQIQFSGTPSFDDRASIYDLDLYDTAQADVQKAHARGKKVLCYINAGAVEDWRPDASQFPPSVVGNAYAGWAGEHWLDIRAIDRLAPIMSARIQLCADKGFDGIDFDNMNSFENNTGFPLQASDQITYNTWLASLAHAKHVLVGLKNDPSQANTLVGVFDFAIVESCAAEGWCTDFSPFTAAHKPVYAIEYTDVTSAAAFKTYCKRYTAQGYNLVLKHQSLDAWAQWCQ